MEVRIADFVGDSSGQAAYGGQAILHAHLAFQAANLGEVVKGVDKSQITARAHVERGNHNAKSFAEAVASHVADFGIAAAAAEVRQRILKEIGHGAAAQLGFGNLEQLLGGAIDQRDASVEPGGDDAAAHGLHDVFVERLQIFERATGIFQLDIHLAQFAHQQAGQIGDGEVGKQVDEDHYLQCLELGMRGRIGGNDQVVIQFEDGSEEDESQGRA